MTTHAAPFDLFAVRLCDLHKRDLRDVMNDALDAASASPETARTVHALRHAAELVLWAAEAVLEGDHAGRVTSPESVLSWASAKLGEVWDGGKFTAPDAST